MSDIYGGQPGPPPPTGQPVPLPPPAGYPAPPGFGAAPGYPASAPPGYPASAPPYGAPGYPTGPAPSNSANRNVVIGAVAAVAVIAVAAVVAVVLLRDKSDPVTQPTRTTEVTPTEEPTTEPPSGDELDFSLTPNFGTHSLTSGFTPDPWSLDVVSGGSIDASSIDGCTGWATAAPDVELDWHGTSDFLRIFATADDAGEDTSLIINDPLGDWYCNDDAAGLDPSIDFQNPEEGTYDIWIGSYSETDYVSATVYVTELAS